MTVPQTPKRSAEIVYAVMDRTCELVGHAGGCGLVNRRFGFYRGEGRIVEFPNPAYRLFRWAEEKSRTTRYVRVGDAP